MEGYFIWACFVKNFGNIRFFGDNVLKTFVGNFENILWDKFGKHDFHN
jgi:hypothetical protein